MSKEEEKKDSFLLDQLNDSNVSSNLSSNSARSSRSSRSSKNKKVKTGSPNSAYSDDSKIMEVNPHNFARMSIGLKRFIESEEGIEARLKGLMEEMNYINDNTQCIKKAFIFCKNPMNKEGNVDFCGMEETECKGVSIMAAGLMNRNNILLVKTQIKYVKLKIEIEQKKQLNNPEINNSLIALNNKLAELTEEMSKLENDFLELNKKDKARNTRRGGKYIKCNKSKRRTKREKA